MSEEKIRPLFLIKTGTMSRKDINRAEKQCGICIAECSDTDAARYSEPPLMANVDEQARAAMSLMRRVIGAPGVNSYTSFTRADLTKWFVDELMKWDNAPKRVQQVKR